MENQVQLKEHFLSEEDSLDSRHDLDILNMPTMNVTDDSYADIN